MSAANTLATPAREPAAGRNPAPRISIAMPVYNGAATVGQAIESLLAQTYGDFELIVSDNASTDATSDLVQGYARKDSRIRYTRQSQNIGGPGNYSFVARVARGEYVKWAAAGDWCAPTLLERCLEVIAARPDAVLAAPRTRLFASDIATAEDYARDIAILDERPLDRFRRQISEMQLNNAMNGLIRASALRRTRLIEAYCHSDMVLMGRLALQGKFLLVDERLLYRRMEKSSATSLQSPMERLRFYYPKMNARSLFQNWKLHAGWVRAVVSATMPLREKKEALGLVARRCYWQWPALVDDLRDAWRYLTGSREAVV
jgi:glycosyltransferase involved in cell wall biosynthesis